MNKKSFLVAKKIARKLILLSAVVALVTVACKKDNHASPVIKQVRLLDSTARDSFFTKALPGTLVVIEGANFEGLIAVTFNDQPAVINTALNSGTNILARISPNTPTPATYPGASNMLRIFTGHGQASYAFTVVPPGPSVTAASNENALPGQTITVTGSNLYSLSSIVFPGNISTTSFTVNADATQVTVTVPAGVSTGDSLRLIGKYGTGASNFVFDNFLAEKPGYLADFECCGTYFGWQWWGGNKTDDANLFPGPTGSYIEVHPVNTPINAGDGSWYGDNRAVMVAASPWVDDVSNPIASYALKFEVSVKTPWTTGSIFIHTTALQDDKSTWAYLAKYAPWQSASSGQFVTTGWQTVTIPLTQFLSTATGNSNYNSSGTPAANFTALMGGAASECDFMLYNDGKTPLTGFDAAFDNIRIVRIK
ncbi:MAG TPA: glycan-binding surface protein [Puia sp.]|nr:glycan-binding surface protein [Puia sp.]